MCIKYDFSVLFAFLAYFSGSIRVLIVCFPFSFCLIFLGYFVLLASCLCNVRMLFMCCLCAVRLLLMCCFGVYMLFVPLVCFLCAFCACCVLVMYFWGPFGEILVCFWCDIWMLLMRF